MPSPAIYARVSTVGQADGHSIPAQINACRAYCTAQGWPEPRAFIEAGVSAFSDDPATRPVFTAMLEAAERREIDIVITLDIDRFSRSTLAALLSLSRLEAAGATLVFVNDPGENASPERRMLFAIKASFAELESAKKSARIKLSQDLMRAEGKWFNQPPFGATIGPDQRLTLDPARSTLLRRILTEAAVDSDNTIAERLIMEGVPPPGVGRKPGRWGVPNTGIWYPSTIRDIVRRGGWLATQPDPWPQLWLAALERPRRPKATNGRAVRFLSGLLRCPCGGVITYGGRRGPLDRLTMQCHGWRVRRERAHCPHRKTYADVYEAKVMVQLLALPDPHAWIIADPDRDMSAERAAIAEDRQRLVDVYRAKLIDKPQFDAEVLQLDQRAAALPSARPQVRAMRDRWPALRRALPGLEPADQNEVARQLIKEILIDGQRALVTWRPEYAATFGLLQ